MRLKLTKNQLKEIIKEIRSSELTKLRDPSPTRSLKGTTWAKKITTSNVGLRDVVPGAVGVSWFQLIGNKSKFDLSDKQRDLIARNVDQAMLMIKKDLIKKGYEIINISYSGKPSGTLRAGKAHHFEDEMIHHRAEARPDLEEYEGIMYWCTIELGSWPTHLTRSKIDTNRSGPSIASDYSKLLEQIEATFENRLFEASDVEAEWIGEY